MEEKVVVEMGYLVEREEEEGGVVVELWLLLLLEWRRRWRRKRWWNRWWKWRGEVEHGGWMAKGKARAAAICLLETKERKKNERRKKGGVYIRGRNNYY